MQEGDELLMFSPFYVNYVNYTELSGGKPIEAPMKVDAEGRWQYDFEKFESLINERTKVVFLTNPHNPTGKMFTEDEIKRISDILADRPDIVVVADDVYYHLPFDGQSKPYLPFAAYGDNWKRTLSVYSAGKLFSCTGWKVGWVIGPEDLVKHVSYIHESTCFVINVPCQIAVAEGLDKMHEPYKGEKDYVSYVQKQFTEGYHLGKELFTSMKELGLRPDEVDGGYFLPLEITEKAKSLIPEKYFSLEDYEDDPNSNVIKRDFSYRGSVPLDYAFCRWLAIEKGMTLMPMTCFQMAESENLFENYVRLSVCKPRSFFEDPELQKRA